MIRFRMFKISVGQFAILSQDAPQGDINMSAKMDLKHAADGGAIQVCASFVFEHGEEKIMLLEVACEFVIHKDDLQKLTKDGKVTIPKDTIDYFIAQTVGASRGILHCKTEGTPFNGIVLPPMNVTGFFKDDMVINLQ